MITISCCLIVKDEEAVLARCLDSLRMLVDEIIIVDTGSTDSTKAIAQKYTQNVYDFVWINDFSAARNFAFSKATKEYIYSADADEVIDDENRRKFIDLKHCLLPEIEIVQMVYSNQLEHNTTYNYDKELRPKLYKRLRQFVWIDPLHESVRHEPVIYDSEIEILHMPVKNHAARDFHTFLSAIKKHGGLSKKLRGMYARELYIAGNDSDFANAAAYFTILSQTIGIDAEELRFCQCIIARAARLCEDRESFYRAIIKLFALGEPPSEACYELGLYYTMMNDDEEATIWFYNAAYETKPEMNLKFGTEYPLARLAECYRRLGKEEDAEAYENILS